jgi:alpha-L-fucosidase
MNLKTKLQTAVLFIALMAFFACAPEPADKPLFPENHAEKLEWWKDARFGMFIHWGPVSLKGTEIGWSRGREIPVSEYDSLYLQFNPVKYNADEWVSVAKEAGMKYIVFTSKHHDGFCNWDTEYTDYNIMNSPFQRDVMAELAEACRKQGMALGFYHSTCDWHHPDFPLTSPGGRVEREVSHIDRYTDYLKNQSVEIIEKYGPLLVMWYDVPQRFDSIRGQGVIDRIREVQPGILVNNRSGAPGDFSTPEQRVGGFQNNRPWETCMTIAQQWAWKPNDVVKSTEQCLHTLIRSAGGDGNLLFNVGPRPDGKIEPLQVERLKEMGAWLKKYGHSIYGTRGGPFKPTDWGVSTRKENIIYLHLLNWSGASSEISLPDIGMAITGCRVVGGNTLDFSVENDEIQIQIGDVTLHPVNTIVEIEFDGNVMEVEPVDAKPNSLSYQKKVTGSSNLKARWSNHQWMDIKSVTNGDWSGDFWHPAQEDANPWLEIDLGSVEKVQKAVIYERGQNIKAFELQYKAGDKWITFYEGTEVGERVEITWPETELKLFRMVVTRFDEIPGIYEIVLL